MDTSPNNIQLYKAFWRAVEYCDFATMKAFLELGGDPNLKRPRYGDTAIHMAAGSGARDAVRILMASGKCDHLIRDRHGNLPSDSAYLYGRDPALARLLSIKERKQAEAQGIVLTFRP